MATYEDLGYSSLLTRALKEESINNSNSEELIQSGSVNLDQTTIQTLKIGQSISSENFNSGVAGWQINGNGNLEANNGTFRGAITIGSGNNVFKADTNGIYLGNATFASAPFRVAMDGSLVASSATITGSISGRLTSTIAAAIDSSGHFVDANLSTASKTILGDFTFGESGAIKMITDSNNGLWISPTGLLGKKAGITTFAIETDGDATFAGTLNAATGTLGEINVPNAEEPLFRIDRSGNVECSSLKRSDFHFTTIFESVDGYGSTGSVSSIESGALIETAAVDESFSEIYRDVLFDGFSWNKKKQIVIIISVSNFTGGLQTAQIGVGTPFYTATVYGFGIYIDNEDVYGYTGNGSSTTTFKIGVVSELFTEYSKITIDYEPGVRCRFIYNDGVLGTITTTLPSGTSDAGRILNASVTAGEAEIKRLRLHYYDFWQAL